jgi:hypothetical protein
MNRRCNSFVLFLLPFVAIAPSNGADRDAEAHIQSVPSRFAKIPVGTAPISDVPIVATKNVSVQLTYDSDATTLQNCINKDLTAALAKVFLVDASGTQKEVGRFTVGDLWGGASCNGHVNRSKEFPMPLSDKGEYILIITVFSALYHWHGGDLTITPRLVVTADAVTAVDHKFTSPGGEQTTNELHLVKYQ